MYLNVSTGDHAISQEYKVQKFSYNSYDDVGVILTVVLPRTVTLINRLLLYVGRIFLLN
jgi:hypothetical protein